MLSNKYIIFIKLVVISFVQKLNPLIPTSEPHSSGPLYSNTVTGTLAVDGWALGCYIWYS